MARDILVICVCFIWGILGYAKDHDLCRIVIQEAFIAKGVNKSGRLFLCVYCGQFSEKRPEETSMVLNVLIMLSNSPF